MLNGAEKPLKKCDFVQKGVESMLQDKIAGIVTKLKKVREENGLSYQRICDLVEQNGDCVSLSTIRRVFEPGSEDYGFQYENTLLPIARAVLGMYPESEAENETHTDAAGVSSDAADALKAIIEYKTEKIASLKSQIERMESSYARRLDFLTGQIDLKDARIDRLHGIIERMIDALLPESGGVVHVSSLDVKAGRGTDLSEEIEN